MSFDFGEGKMFAKPTHGEGGWVSLGEVQAIKITLEDGTTLYSGKPEAVFDMKLTEDDKELLKAMQIGGKS